MALVEKQGLLGGALINTGTVPSKTLRETALYFSGLNQRGLYGIDYTLRENLTVPQFMHREVEVTQNLRDLVSLNLARHSVTVFHGEARFKDPNTVVVSNEHHTETLRAPVILIATGSRPAWPAGTPHDFRALRLRHDPSHGLDPEVAGGDRGRRDRLRIRDHLPGPRGQGDARLFVRGDPALSRSGD